MFERSKWQDASYEVIVTGGGMTGLCAAIASARGGAKTALIQDRPVFGGNASSEIRMHICGASANETKKNAEETGIIREIQLENKFLNDTYNYSVWDRVLYTAAVQEPNLTYYLNTAMREVITEGNQIRQIICYQLTTEINWRFSAPLFLDCTGNGTLGYLAGADFRTGSESKQEFQEPHAPERPNQERMGNTLLFKAVDRGRPVPFVKPAWAYDFTEDQLRYRKHADVKPLFDSPAQAANLHRVSLIDQMSDKEKEFSFDGYCLDYGYWWIEVTGRTGDIISEYESIRDELLKCVYGVWDHIKNGGDHGAENYDLLWVGMLPGVRESRRLEGDYILTEKDVLENRVFPDAVAYGGWPIDNHAPNGIFDYDLLPSFIHDFDGLYTIPYRCFLSKNIENLLIGGRSLSASKLAMASSRVMGTCAVGGQAMGTAAAMCCKEGLLPRELGAQIEKLQQQLLKDDCYIPGFQNQDPLDLARTAAASASTQLPQREAAKVLNGISRDTGSSQNAWESDGIGPHGETLALTFPKAVKVREVRLTFDPDLSKTIKITLSSRRISQQRPGVPEKLVKDYTLSFYLSGSLVYERRINDNHQRLNVIPLDPVECDRIAVTVLETHGYKNARIFEMRVYG